MSREDHILRRAIEQGLLTAEDLRVFSENPTLGESAQLEGPKWGRRIDFLIQTGRLTESDVRALLGRDPVEVAQTIAHLPQGSENPAQPTSEAGPQIGHLFHGLLIHCLLGEGAMGAAYLASHPILKIPLVVKTFKPAYESGAKEDSGEIHPSRAPGLSIFKEAHLAARVSSPHVVGVIDAGIDTGIRFAVLRYVDGVDVWELLTCAHDTRRPLPVGLVCRILIDAALGLHAIHQAGVIHRDVKPSNLFLGGDGITTIGDFGVAKDANQQDDSGLIAGTLRFMAPEQLTNQKIDRRSDLYSLGATGHLLATGTFAIEARNLPELQQALNQPYVPPMTDDPVGAYLFSVIGRMLRKDPEERYQTAEMVAHALRRVISPFPEFVPISEMEAQAGPVRLRIAVGNLAQFESDVIVNAANSLMLMRVGVAGALRRAGGESIETEALEHAPVPMGTVVWTGAGNLRANWMAHAVAAIEGAICLQRCTLRVLLGAESRLQRSVAFPALGTGVGEVPMDLAAKLMLEAICTFTLFEPQHVRTVTIVLRTEEAARRWRENLRFM